MRRAECETYRDRLLTLRTRLTSAVNRSIDAIVESIRPPGEHDIAPAEGVDCETTLERTEAGMLTAVNAALDRIDRDEYGTCTACGRKIAVERLKAVPWTPYCTGCERKHESGGTV